MELTNERKYFVWKAYDKEGSFLGLYAVRKEIDGEVAPMAAKMLDRYLVTDEAVVASLEFFTSLSSTSIQIDPIIDMTNYYRFAVENLYMNEEEASSFITYMWDKNVDILSTVLESMEGGYDGPSKFEFDYSRLSDSEWDVIDAKYGKQQPYVWVAPWTKED